MERSSSLLLKISMIVFSKGLLVLFSPEVQVDDFNLKEWGGRISRENVTVSSTASSPGYTARSEEIDPSIFIHNCAKSITSKDGIHMGVVRARGNDSELEMERSREMHKQFFIRASAIGVFISKNTKQK